MTTSHLSKGILQIDFKVDNIVYKKVIMKKKHYALKLNWKNSYL